MRLPDHFYEDGRIRWGEVLAMIACYWIVGGIAVGVYAWAVKGWVP